MIAPRPTMLASQVRDPPRPASHLELPQHPRGYLSWSQLSTYRSCPLKYYFRYVENRPEEELSASLLLGSGIHRAIEFFHRQQLQGDELPSIESMLDEFWEEWTQRAQSNLPLEFGADESLSTVGQLAERMLKAFCGHEAAQIEGSIIGIEEELLSQIDASCPPLLARVDLLIDRDREWVLRDYKTSRSKWTQQTAEASAEQLLLYSQLLQLMRPDRPIRLEFVVITKTKTPTVQLFEVAHDLERQRRTTAIATRIFQSMQAGIVYPNPSPMNCGGCPYAQACAAWPG
jgi:putative RecB family exonuclease